MQFAPAWLKKPNGAHAPGTPASSHPPSMQGVDSGFPLPGARHGVPAAAVAGGPAPLGGQSYSQIASPRAESFPSGFGAALGDTVNGTSYGGAAGSGDKARPFRYSRETMLALFEEDKVRARPVELMEWAQVRSNNSGRVGGEGEGVTSIILSGKAGLPMGLVEWTVEEKKVRRARYR